MATFSTLPAEIHNRIAEYSDNNDRINLCCTSKWMNEVCSPLLYRHVNLRLDRYGVCRTNREQEYYKMEDERKWQQQFVHKLLSHPEYGKHVRSLKALLSKPRSDEKRKSLKSLITHEELWRAMQSLTQVQSVDLGSRNSFAYRPSVPTKQIPNDLFHSATSVTLVGRMQYSLAKSILNAVNPATLKYLCLDMVREGRSGALDSGNRGEDGRNRALGATIGLLKPLTGRCTALRTLILRRVGQSRDGHGWHAAAEDASYIEWASFIRSVQGTLEKFTFEQAEEKVHKRLRPIYRNNLGIMDERFQRLILPTIVSGNWPCLTVIELQGIKSQNGHAGNATLKAELRALLGENTKIVVKENGHYVKDTYRPNAFW